MGVNSCGLGGARFVDRLSCRLSCPVLRHDEVRLAPAKDLAGAVRVDAGGEKHHYVPGPAAMVGFRHWACPSQRRVLEFVDDGSFRCE